MNKIIATLSISLIGAAHTAAQAQQAVLPHHTTPSSAQANAATRVQTQPSVLHQTTAHFDAKVEVQCQQLNCTGPATITLYEKGTQNIIQQFESDSLNLHLNQNSQSADTKSTLATEQNALIFYDVNFDGTEDLAIRNGNTGLYGGPSYDVYVYNEQWKKFVYNEELSILTEADLGMFQLDPQQKHIITLSKSGCCYHVRSEYKVNSTQQLQLVRELIEDSNSTAKRTVKVTERVLIDGKWKQSIKNYPISKYKPQTIN